MKSLLPKLLTAFCATLVFAGCSSTNTLQLQKAEKTENQQTEKRPVVIEPVNNRLNKTAILSPIVRASGAPSYLAADFYAHLENSLLSSDEKVKNQRTTAKILKENNITNLHGISPKVSKRLNVKNLLQPTITRFQLIGKKFHVEKTGVSRTRWVGVIEGNIRAVSIKTGQLLASIPFREKVVFDKLPRPITRDWAMEDYGKYLIKTVVTQNIATAVLKNKALTGK